jgi:predicted SAM-dependent methyltransferase
MRDRGWTVSGVEINPSAAALGRHSKGLDIFSGTLQQAEFPDNYFDYIRSNHSLEHISCPGGTLDEVHRILKPNGKLFIGVPNIDSLSARLFKQYWWHLCAPVHTFGYSIKTLSRLLAKHKFRVERISCNSDWFGILGSLQIWMNRENGKKSMDGKLANIYLVRLFCQWIANLADLAHQGDMIEVTAMKAE